MKNRRSRRGTGSVGAHDLVAVPRGTGKPRDGGRRTGVNFFDRVRPAVEVVVELSLCDLPRMGRSKEIRRGRKGGEEARGLQYHTVWILHFFFFWGLEKNKR
jgi:hypothetical protein